MNFDMILYKGKIHIVNIDDPLATAVLYFNSWKQKN
jgi:hypothetical protein